MLNKEKSEQLLSALEEHYNKAIALKERPYFNEPDKAIEQLNEVNELIAEFGRSNASLENFYLKEIRDVNKKIVDTETAIKEKKAEKKDVVKDPKKVKSLNTYITKKKERLNGYKTTLSEIKSTEKIHSAQVKGMLKELNTLQKHLSSAANRVRKSRQKEYEQKLRTQRNRHHLPYPVFSEATQMGVDRIHPKVSEAILSEFKLYPYNESTGRQLTDAFQGIAFQVIIESIGVALNLDTSEVLVIYTENNAVFFKYEFNGVVNEDMKAIGAKFDFSDSKAWFLSDLDNIDSAATSKLIKAHFKAIVDINTKSVFFRKDQELQIAMVDSQKPKTSAYLLEQEVLFKGEDFVRALDEYANKEDFFKRNNRGLSVFDPIERKFVKFSPTGHQLKTKLPLLIFRLSFGSYFSVFIVDTVEKKITDNLYENYLTELADYRKEFWTVTENEFQISSNILA